MPTLTTKQKIAAAGVVVALGTVGLLIVAAGCKQLTRKAHWTPPPPAKLLQQQEVVIQASIISTAFVPAEANVWAIQYFYPITFTNRQLYRFTNLFTNVWGLYRAQWKATVEWASVPGKLYAVESSPHVEEAKPFLFTNSIGAVVTNGWYGMGWLPCSLPIQAAGAVSRWTGGIPGETAPTWFYRIREL